MKSLHFTSFLLQVISSSLLILSLVDNTFGYASIDFNSNVNNNNNGEPATATLSLVRDPEDPSNRYSLQVSTDQINHYLKTLSNVPSSIYDSAHIITDFDESTLSNAYARPTSSSSSSVSSSLSSSSSPSSSPSEPNGQEKYTFEEPITFRQLEKANLYHESNYGSESQLHPKRQMTIKLFDELDLGQPRITADERALRRIYFSNRDFIIRKDEPAAQAASAATSTGKESAVKVISSEVTDSTSPTLKVTSSSNRIATLSDPAKVSSIEIGQKPAVNEYPPSLPASIRSTYGLPRELVSKEKNEADLEREKEEQAQMEKVQDDLMKELYAIQKQQQQSQQSNEAIVKEHESSPKESISQGSSVPKNEVDLKTVQTLLTTLIKQIEQIQAVAKSLPLGGQSQSSNEELVRIKEPGMKVYKEQSNVDVPLGHEIRGKRIEWSHGGHRPRKSHKGKYVKPSADEHQEVFLKAPDLIKLLTGETFDPEYSPVTASATVARRIVPMPMTLPSYHIPRSTPAYPFAYTMPFTNFQLASFYPGKWFIQTLPPEQLVKLIVPR